MTSLPVHNGCQRRGGLEDELSKSIKYPNGMRKIKPLTAQSPTPGLHVAELFKPTGEGAKASYWRLKTSCSLTPAFLIITIFVYAP